MGSILIFSHLSLSWSSGVLNFVPIKINKEYDKILNFNRFEERHLHIAGNNNKGKSKLTDIWILILNSFTSGHNEIDSNVTRIESVNSILWTWETQFRNHCLRNFTYNYITQKFYFFQPYIRFSVLNFEKCNNRAETKQKWSLCVGIYIYIYIYIYIIYIYLSLCFWNKYLQTEVTA